MVPRSPTLLTILSIQFLACAACGLGGSSGGDFEVTVTIDPGLEGGIEVVSTRGDRPGGTNPMDVEIVLANAGDVPRRLELRGSWQDDRGGFQGGANAVRVLQPGQRDTFTTGTHSTRASSFELAVAETTATEDDLLSATVADASARAAGGGFGFTVTPSLESIPTWSPRGVANDVPFTAKTMFFRPEVGGVGWKLELSDHEFDPVQGTALPHSANPALQTVYLDLPREPKSGAVFEQELGYGGGYFQIKPSPDADHTTSWNTSLAWVIEISEWQLEPYVAGGSSYQQGGTASGRLYVAFKGSGGKIQDSWVAGSFEDVPIVYYGPPPGAR